MEKTNQNSGNLYARRNKQGRLFLKEDLPTDPSERDKVLLRVIGSPDPYGQQIDGMGGATSSTSKVVIVSKSNRPGCDVDYLFGQVDIGQPLVDWSGNCGNLTSAVGPFSIYRGLVDAPPDGMAAVNIWQENIGKKIITHVPMKDGEVQELGDFVLDGVNFPAAEIKLEFLNPGADGGPCFQLGIRSISFMSQV
ncbi:PrpF domain-containing protein [Bacillus licheniformis]